MTHYTHTATQQAFFYPFGMTMYQHNYYGPLCEQNKMLYNSKELQDNIIAGINFDWYDYGARFYDAQIGRWHVVDPLADEYVPISPYCYVANNPISFIDPDGRKIRLANNYAGAMENIARIVATSYGSHVINQLISDPKTYTMRSVFFTTSSDFDPDNRRIRYVGNPWRKTVYRDGGANTSMTVMGHEIFHAYEHTRIGFTKENVRESFKLRNALETRAVSFANYLRAAYGLELRNQYPPYEGDFNQFAGGDRSEKISDFTTLGGNKSGTSMGFSYVKTTKTVLNYKKVGRFKIPYETKTDTATYYIIVRINEGNYVTFQIFNNEQSYRQATFNW